jgi:hypothetical protein
VDEAADPIAADEVASWSDELAARQRCGQPERLVRPRAVVVIDVGAQHPFEVPPTGPE